MCCHITLPSILCAQPNLAATCDGFALSANVKMMMKNKKLMTTHQQLSQIGLAKFVKNDADVYLDIALATRGSYISTFLEVYEVPTYPCTYTARPPRSPPPHC